MGYTLTAEWTHKEESEYDDLGPASVDAAEIMRRHPDAIVVIHGDGVGLNIWSEKVLVEV